MRLRLDMHVHTKYSKADGHGTPRQIMARAKQNGLNGLAITDHNELGGALEALEVVKSPEFEGFIIIPGCEVRAEAGDILAYGITTPIPSRRSVEETIDLIHDAGGIAVCAHPFRVWAGVGGTAARSPGFDALEVVNGGSIEVKNQKARRLAGDIGKPQTGGSDCHWPRTVGRAGTELELPSHDSSPDVDELLKAIRKGYCEPFGKGLAVPIGFLKSMWAVFRWLGRGARKV